MSLEQISLASYEDYDPLAQLSLPARDGYGWADDITTLRGGLSAVQARADGSEYITLNGDSVLSEEMAYYVTASDAQVEAFIDEHGQGTIDVPQYYSRFGDWENHVSVVSAASGSHGYGISRRNLEAALRIATGGGRYSTSSIDVIDCGRNPFLVRTDDETFAFGLEPVSQSEPPEPCTDVAGLTVAEERESVIAGIDRAISVFDTQFGVSITGYRELNHDGKHVFETADGRPLRVPGYICRSLAGVTTDPDDVLGTHTIETQFDETYTVEWNELHHELGDTPRGTDAPVVGYQFTYSDPRANSKASLSGKVKAKAKYLMLALRERDDYLGVRRYDRAEVLARLETENEEYSIMGSNL
jgi:hypothetical protein